jgi:hypothetical protein
MGGPRYSMLSLAVFGVWSLIVRARERMARTRAQPPKRTQLMPMPVAGEPSDRLRWN